MFERDRKCGDARISYDNALKIFEALKARGALSGEYVCVSDRLKKLIANRRAED